MSSEETSLPGHPQKTRWQGPAKWSWVVLSNAPVDVRLAGYVAAVTAIRWSSPLTQPILEAIGTPVPIVGRKCGHHAAAINPKRLSSGRFARDWATLGSRPAPEDDMNAPVVVGLDLRCKRPVRQWRSTAWVTRTWLVGFDFVGLRP